MLIDTVLGSPQLREKGVFYRSNFEAILFPLKEPRPLQCIYMKIY